MQFSDCSFLHHHLQRGEEKQSSQATGLVITQSEQQTTVPSRLVSSRVLIKGGERDRGRESKVRIKFIVTPPKPAEFGSFSAVNGRELKQFVEAQVSRSELLLCLRCLGKGNNKKNPEISHQKVCGGGEEGGFYFYLSFFYTHHRAFDCCFLCEFFRSDRSFGNRKLALSLERERRRIIFKTVQEERHEAFR